MNCKSLKWLRSPRNQSKRGILDSVVVGEAEAEAEEGAGQETGELAKDSIVFFNENILLGCLEQKTYVQKSARKALK